MIDIADQLTATYREVSRAPAAGSTGTDPDGETAENDDSDRPGHTGDAAISVLLRRRFPADPDAVWRALTEPKHLERWFGPVRCSEGSRAHGDTEFEVDGVLTGSLVHRKPSHLLEFLRHDSEHGRGGVVITVRMTPDEDGRTVVELTHTAPSPDSAEATPGGVTMVALTEGTTWDLAFLALARYLEGLDLPDPATWRRSIEVQKFAQHALSAWADAGTEDRDDGEVSPDVLTGCVRWFAPDLIGTART